MVGYDLICIGSGPAGQAAAICAAGAGPGAGKRVAIIEQDARPGGSAVRSGAIPLCALRETAMLHATARRRPIAGLTLSLDRSSSIERLMPRLHLVRAQQLDQFERVIEQHGIDVLHGRASFVDGNTLSVEAPDGCRSLVNANAIIIATGARPARPDCVSFDDQCVFDAETVFGLERLPRSMIVVGGGAIGIQFATIFAELGVAVTLIDAGDTLLPHIDQECRLRLEMAMRRQGITVRLMTRVRSVRRVANTAVAQTDDGQQYEADTLLWTCGRQPNVDLLDLDRVNVATGDGGVIRVDEQFRTSSPTIYAAGGVIGESTSASTSTAAMQGRDAARNACNVDQNAQPVTHAITSIRSIPEIAAVGLTEDRARSEQREIVIGSAFYAANAHGRLLADDEGMMRCVFDGQTRVQLGVSIVGQHANQLMHTACAMIAGRQTVADLLTMPFDAVSLASLFADAAADAANQFQARRQALGSPSPTSTRAA